MSTNIRMDTNTTTPDGVCNPVRNVFFVGLLVALVSVIYILSAVFIPPIKFPVGAYVDIPNGATLYETANILEDRGVISSAFFFREYIRFFENDSHVVAGKYYFDARLCLASVVSRLVAGDFHIPRLKILIPEGSDSAEIADAIKRQIPEFDSKKFLILAAREEGYLFPDTYFFFGTVAPEEVIAAMKENFQTRVKDVQLKILSSGKNMQDVLTMASIIERETVTPESRRIVSGILWKRIKIGMPLQVDATFDYINGKNTYDLTVDDLNIDSKYNTYEYKGLPPGPICNPGLDSIIAAIEPASTPYLYYLSEKDGTMHYAKDFEEHKSNKFKYMR
ncbi:MAG: endolytic transglycosylase MltG [Candidatus Paceibacterota bacterium]